MTLNDVISGRQTMLTASIIINKIASPATDIMKVTRQTLQFLAKSCNGQ